MDWSTIIPIVGNITKEFGFPVVIAIYFAVINARKDELFTKSLDGIKKSIDRQSEKITVTLNSMLQYKRGDLECGDFFIKQMKAGDEDE